MGDEGKEGLIRIMCLLGFRCELVSVLFVNKKEKENWR